MKSLAPRIVAPLALLTLLGCGNESASDNTRDDSSSDDKTDEERQNASQNDAEVAKPAVYADETLPRIDLSTDAGVTTFPLEQIGEDNGDPGLVYAAALAGYYILRVQRADGSFGYLYDPKAGTWADDNSIHRQCGATFTLLWVQRATQRDEFLVAAGAALRYLTSQGEWSDADHFAMVDFGATALVSLSLTQYAELANTTDWDEHITGVGNTLYEAVDDEGRISKGGTLAWAQLHQSLWSLYRYTGEERYLNALQRIAQRAYEQRDNRDEVTDPYLYGLWANEPLTELYLETQEQWLADFVLGIGDSVSKVQYDAENTDEADQIGGYPSKIGATAGWNTSLKLEAVIDAYRMAEHAGDDVRAQHLASSARAAAQFLVRLQHRKGETDDWAEPSLSVGGVPFSKSDPTVRVDLPHHMANAILKVAAYTGDEVFPGQETVAK